MIVSSFCVFQVFFLLSSPLLEPPFLFYYRMNRGKDAVIIYLCFCRPPSDNLGITLYLCRVSV